MKRGQKAQITVFVIIGVVLVVIIIGFVYVNQSNKQERLNREFFEREDIKPTLDNIQTLSIDCLKEISKGALRRIGVQGGCYNKPKNYLDFGGYFVPYYYLEGETVVPSKQNVERELGKYIDDNLKLCLDEASFTGFNLNYREPVTSVRISEKEVYFESDLEIEIKKESYTTIFELKDYPVTVKSELYAILEIAEYFGESHREDPALYCISCIGDMAAENNLYVDVINIGDNSMLFVISDNHTSSEPYSFEFLNKYTGEEKSPEESDEDFEYMPIIPEAD